MTGSLSLAPLVLVAIIFLWTPPHFWALALFRSDDYARAGVPMLPVVSGKRATRWNIFGYTLALVPAGLVPALIGLGGPIYLAAASLLGAAFLWKSVAVLRETDAMREPAARRLFGISLIYLFALFASLLCERLMHIAPLGSWGNG